jgi:hypothetical protein
MPLFESDTTTGEARSCDLLDQAMQVALRARRVSVSLLQRNLRLGYSATLALLQRLEEAGVVTAPDAANMRHLTTAYAGLMPEPARQSIATLDGARYLRRLRQVALYAFEMGEEGGTADTRAIGLLKPSGEVGNSDYRAALQMAFADPTATVTDGATSLHDWLVARGTLEPLLGIELHIAAACAPYERARRAVTTHAERVERAFLRLATYLRESLEESPDHETARIDTRVIEYFVPAAYVLHGVSRAGIGHHEHVVPCAYLRQESLAMLRAGHTNAEVVRFLRRCLAIVTITLAERDALDRSDGLGLKDRMPDGWQPDTGDIFARLVLAGIAFDMPLQPQEEVKE